MRKDRLGIEREEKVCKEKNSQHGTKHPLFKKNPSKAQKLL
jgi:hypothetical protein